MKKLKNILPLFFAAALITACYEDKGNYDYSETPEFTVELPALQYSKRALTEPLTITPIIETDTPESDLSYLWTVFRTYSSARYTEVVVDTISREKALNWIVPLDAGIYNLVFRVQDDRTGKQFFQKATLTVTTQFSRGFYVLKESGTGCDLDLFYLPQGTAAPEAPVYNCIEGKYGTPMSGKPVSFNVVFDYSFLDEETAEFTTTRSLNVCTEDDIWVINSLDMNVIYNHDDLFYGDTPEEKPIAIVDNYYAVCYFSDKGHYYSYQAPQESYGAIEGAGKMGMLTNPDDNGVKVFPQMFYMPFYGTSSYYGAAFMYDEKNGRFLFVNFDGTPMLFSNTGGHEVYKPNGIENKILYYGGSNVANTFNTWAVFQDKDDVSKRYLYKLAVGYGQTNNPIREVTELGADKKFSKATHYANNETSALIMYFVYDNEVYLYNTVSGNEESIHPTQIPASEEITYISHRWSAINEADTFSYLAIATHNAGKYKVYLYDMDLGGRIAATPARILEGDGKVFKMNFVSDHLHMTSLGYAAWGF
ncbi:hypothetical protein LJC45_03275 [Alistipes sp. OttesenSCG-928-B03]|nr:hypothetical protein [Alistipes sp. OttesenSCG-928-B03]